MVSAETEQSMTVRAVFYKLVGAGAIANEPREYGRLTAALLPHRMFGVGGTPRRVTDLLRHYDYVDVPIPDDDRSDQDPGQERER